MIDPRSSEAVTGGFALHASSWSSPAAKAVAGGDWCDVAAVSDDVLALTIGDVCGHGEAAASTMEVLRSAILDGVRSSTVPSTILGLANSLAYALRNDGIIATAIVAFFDRRQRTFTFANAGHPPPLICSGDTHAFLSHSPGDLPLGIFSLHRAAEYVVALPADVLLTLYTDGITEHRRDLIAGERELARACRHVYGRPHLNAARSIAEHVFRTGRGGDDAAVLAVRTSASASAAF